MKSPNPEESAIPLDQAAILALQRRFQPPLHVEQDPALVGVVGDRFEREVPRDGVEELPDVEIEHPVVSPTALPANPQRVVSGPPRPIPKGVLVEPRLHPGSRYRAHDHLGDPIRDSRHP